MKKSITSSYRNTAHLTAATGLTALLLVGTQVQAAPALEEVVVTAQKRSESLQDVPISVSAVSGDTITQNAIQNMEDLAVLVPNLNISDTPGTNYISMRGLGSGAGTSSFEQSVGLYIDGIYAGRAALFQSPFLDIERVEVLRGPQGVLFGKNSIAGAVSVHTARPTQEFDASLSASYELEFDGYDVWGFVSGPLGDNVAARLTAKTGQSGPYVDNQIRREEQPENDIDVIRAALTWDSSDTTSLWLKLEYAELKETGTTFQIMDRDADAPLPAPPFGALAADLFAQMVAGGEDFRLNQNSYLNELSTLDQTSSNVTLELNQQLGEFELTYLGGYAEYDRDSFQDSDFTLVEFVGNTTIEDYSQYSHELRLISPTGDKLDYIAGLSFFSRDLKMPPAAVDFNAPVIASSGLLDYTEDTTSWSAYLQGTWRFSETLRAAAGLRFVTEDKEAAGSQIINEYRSSAPQTNPLVLAVLDEELGLVNYSSSGKRSETHLDPMANLQWDATDNAMLYAAWAQGSKGGGFNSSDRSGQNFNYGDETAQTFEVGLKSELLHGSARLNLALFYTDFDDLQVTSFTGTGFAVGNAAAATSRGVELESLYNLSEHWMVGLNAAYLDATYDSYDATCPNNENQWRGTCLTTNGEFQDMSGENLRFAPEWSGDAFINYETPVLDGHILSGRVNAIYQDWFRTTANLDDYTVQDDTWTFNVRLALESQEGRWQVALAGLNITDEQTMNFADLPPGLPGLYFSNYRPLRRIELSATYRFGQ
ncbi:MAG: TonB-dependent receptor [Pseudomonadota bacterium]